MLFLYADESGDTGVKNSPTRFFTLSGLVVHETKWKEVLDDIVRFRKELRNNYGLKLREEIHCSAFIHNPTKELKMLDRHVRLKILKQTLLFQSNLSDKIRIINIIVDKTNKRNPSQVFESAWKCLFQRFQNTIIYNNFPIFNSTGFRDNGIIIVDRTIEHQLQKLLRKLRTYNPVPNMASSGYRDMPLDIITEDPVHKNSNNSYFIQLCDVNAFFLRQKEQPCKFVKKKSARNYFDHLDSVLCKEASKSNSLGIVRI